MKMLDITNTIPESNYSTSRDGYKPEAIILHITGDSRQGQAVEWFQNPVSKVSAHYVIEKDGLVNMCVHPSNKAYHAGNVVMPTASIYFDKEKTNPNKYSIGIECVSSGEPLTDAQVKSLDELVISLCDTYKIPRTRYNILGHYEFDSISRANDPISSYSVNDVVKRIEVRKMEENKKHWAQDAYDLLKAKGIKINETRFDDKITRGEIFVLLSQLVK